MASTNVAQLLTRGAASDPEQFPAVAAHTSGQTGCTAPVLGSQGINNEAQRKGSSESTQFGGSTVKKEIAVLALTASADCVVPGGMNTSPELGGEVSHLRIDVEERAHDRGASARHTSERFACDGLSHTH